MVKYFLKKISTKYPDIRLLYFRENDSYIKDRFSYEYAGMIIGNCLEAYDERLDCSNFLKDSGLDLKLGRALSVVIAYASNQFHERLAETLFYDNKPAEEWLEILSEEEIDKVKTGEWEHSYWHRALSCLPDFRISLLLDYFETHEGFDFADIVKAVSAFDCEINISEDFIMSFLTKTDASDKYVTELAGYYSNSKTMSKVLAIYYDILSLYEDFHDSCSDLSCWLQIKKAVENKKTVKAKIRETETYFEIPTSAIWDNYGIRCMPFNLFGISSQSSDFSRMDMVLAMNRIEPRPVDVKGAWYYSYNVLESISYHNKIIWKNPSLLGGAQT